MAYSRRLSAIEILSVSLSQRPSTARGPRGLPSGAGVRTILGWRGRARSVALHRCSSSASWLGPDSPRSSALRRPCVAAVLLVVVEFRHDRSPSAETPCSARCSTFRSCCASWRSGSRCRSWATPCAFVALVLVALLGPRSAFVPLVGGMALASLFVVRRLRPLDDRAVFRTDVLARLRGVSFPVRPPARWARPRPRSAEWVAVDAGQHVVVQGEATFTSSTWRLRRRRRRLADARELGPARVRRDRAAARRTRTGDRHGHHRGLLRVDQPTSRPCRSPRAVARPTRSPATGSSTTSDGARPSSAPEPAPCEPAEESTFTTRPMRASCRPSSGSS